VAIGVLSTPTPLRGPLAASCSFAPNARAPSFRPEPESAKKKFGLLRPGSTNDPKPGKNGNSGRLVQNKHPYLKVNLPPNDEAASVGGL
jgi:hypothetical protein